MTGGKRFQLMGAIGFVMLLIGAWSVLDGSKPSPNSIPATTTGKYHLMDLDSKVCVGSWTTQGGQSTLILRDGQGLPRVILEADQTQGGRMSIRDANGQWHYYPDPPPD